MGIKSRQAIRRLKTRGTRHTDLIPRPASQMQQQRPLTIKEAEAILIDVSMRELYNNGDKRELAFVEEILHPNNIDIPEGQPLESFWDILTNTGLMKSVIGFGKQGRLALTSEGYQLMNQYGSYANYLQQKSQNNRAAAPATPAEPLEQDTDVEDVTPPPPPPTEPMDGVH